MEGRYIWVALNKDGSIRHCYMSDTRPPIPEGEPPLTEEDQHGNKINFPTLEITDEELTDIVVKGRRYANNAIDVWKEVKEWDAEKLRREVTVNKGKPELLEIPFTSEELNEKGMELNNKPIK